MHPSAGPFRSLAARLVLALALAAWPAAVPAQDTATAAAGTPAGATPRTGGTLARPAVGIQAQQTATVPDLAGRTPEQARRLLAAAGLELGQVAEGQGSGTPGTVIQQQPRAGAAVAPRSAVQIWLAPRAAAPQPPAVTRPPLAQALVTVPRLAGRTLDDARATLARAGLQVGAVGEAAGAGAPGTVARQSPRPGVPVLRGFAVQVWLVPEPVAPPRDTPADPMMVRVPDLVGRTVEDARAALAAARLALGTLQEAPGAGPPGTVVRQQPAAGSAMLPGSGVGVWRVPAPNTDPSPPAGPQSSPPAVGPAPVAATPAAPATPAAADSAAVPDVRRLALAQARAALAAAGLVAVFDTALADSAAWVVASQQPSAGARLERGGRVALLLDLPAAAAAAPPARPPSPSAEPDRAPPAPRTRSRGAAPWIALAVLLLAAAAAAAAWRGRARGAAPPVAGVSARFRTDAPARVAVEGTPFGDARVRMRMNPGRTVARVAATAPLFASREVAGDG